MNQADKREKAVALLYDESKGTAPEVVASGKGVVARNIIAAAKEAGVYLKKDPDLVELLAQVPIGQELPAELYQTVAEVLAFVYSVNDKFKQKVTLPAERKKTRN
ncbi:MAG: flagellar biosynthesis protein FlhB [Desulfobulbus propionicus]|nr:MAG: flagellar biosynthesis protein FlhB [Desulfobulbus propionicus]